MTRTPLSRASSLLRRVARLPAPLRRETLLGTPLMVRDSVVRQSPDYDDAWLLACSMRARVIFDLGSNMGQAALLELASPGVTDLLLVEPNAEALAIAAENIVRNRLSEKVRFVCAFVSDRAGDRVRLWTVGTGAAGSMYPGHAKSAAKAGLSMDVPTVTLDRLEVTYGLLPDFVKVDVEGAEALVLAGGRGCARRRQTRFLVEMHSNPELPMVENAARVLRWCDELGYFAWYLARGTRLTGPEILADRGRCHLLLQPSDWPYPEWLAGIPQGASLETATRIPDA